LEKYYKNFVRNGAALKDEQKEKLREINKQLSLAELQFGQNVLAETNAYQKWVTDEKELAGLPENVKQSAAEAAKEAGREGQWLFTTKKASFIPVLQYSENRELRRELLTAYNKLADNNNANDNKPVINKIVKLRVQKAQLLGYPTWADYELDDTMAKTPQKVYDFLASVWEPSIRKAREEAAELQKIMDAEGKGEKLKP
jgi:peptidyl-dipeptidase Dcp